jgi:UDP-GlcNAc3NAcA epimerase
MNGTPAQRELDARIGAARATGLTVADDPMRTSRIDMPAAQRRTPSERPRLVSILSARPEIIQAAPLAAALAPVVEEILVHTGQHYDAPMSGSQIEHTELPEPTYNLAIGSQEDAVQLQLGEERIGAVLDLEKPDAVLVRGDTNGTLSGAEAAACRALPLIHVEAGLRSHREGMPEERNRVRTDHLSDLLLAPTESARENLLAEGVRGEIHVTGDVMCDMLLRWAERIAPTSERGYVLATVHRDYNTDVAERLALVLDCLGAADRRVLFPVHPRTRKKMAEFGLSAPANVELLDPVPYRDMLALERGADLIATDSGGVQREAYVWGVPCITLREETEWVETVSTGWNTLVGVDRDRFVEALERPRPAERPPIFGDGKAAQHIADVIRDYLGSDAVKEDRRG